MTGSRRFPPAKVEQTAATYVLKDAGAPRLWM
jgi:hypothetical protein